MSTHQPQHGNANGTALLDELRSLLGLYVVLPSEPAADAVTLWIAATHVQPAWAHAPRLVIRAPEKRCGKSRLLDIVEATCHDPLITVNASPAAVYRAIGTNDPPTLLVDEADTIFGGKKADQNEDLRGLLNAGHQRNRPAIRWDNTTHQLERIPTFAMAALAGIGAMPDTIEDRAVVIRMRRRAPHETVSPYRHRRDEPNLRLLAFRLTEWLRANLEQLQDAEPAMPVEDRAADTWEPLIAVADLAGVRWAERGRIAAASLTAEAADIGAESNRIRLLTDCRAVFGDLDAVPTKVLLERLKEDPEAPWGEYGGQNGLTSMRLGTMLGDYEIRSRNIRFPEALFPGIGQVKGYQRGDFTDAWARYCPPPRDLGTEPPDTAPERFTGQAVPGVPAVPAQVRPGTASASGTAQAVPPHQAVPAVTCNGTAGTPGTATPRPQPAPQQAEPYSGPGAGPCTACGTRHNRYGPGGTALCPTCRAARTAPEGDRR